MPTGIIVCVLSVALGGAIGFLIKDKLSDHLKTNLNVIFGICSMAMAITSINLMQYMPAVIFAIVIGTAIGLTIHLGELVNKVAIMMQKMITKIIPSLNNTSTEFTNQLVTIIVLFCASGTGIYGSLVLGMSNDSSILLSKAILDFFTAMIFACNLGLVVSCIAIPQFIIMFILFLLAGFILPYCTDYMINDFKACGGILMLATGFRICKIKDFPIADMLVAMIIVMPISYFWATYIATLF